MLAVSVTEGGRALAERLHYEHRHGRATEIVPEAWTGGGFDGFVLFLATGAAVRIIAPLLGDKVTDPAVVCVDQAGRFAVALCGGHAGGANHLASEVSAHLGAVAVVTTATDAVGVAGLDQFPGFSAAGDVAGVTVALLDGRFPVIANPMDWPLPAGLAIMAGAGAEAGKAGPERLVITDRIIPHSPGTVVLNPASLVVGVGASRGAPAGDLADLLQAALADTGLAVGSLIEVATIEAKAAEPAVTALAKSLDLPLRCFSAPALAGVDVATPSEVVRRAVGTPSVAEAAALLAAGAGSALVVTKRASATATVAIARRRGPRGHLSVVGLGPGHRRHRTPAADRAVRRADTIIGYGPYVDQCADLLLPAQDVVRSPIGAEAVRAKQALAEAAAGRRVALVCSGDAGIFAMASLVTELAAEHPDLDVDVVPGITAALAAAALLGAPLGHDHALISLSDLLTPWPTIETRLRAAASADLVVALYNPRSAGRDWQLDAALKLLGEHRSAATPVGVVTDAGRDGQHVVLSTLAALDTTSVGMTTCVIVGSSATKVLAGRMVTPRGLVR